MKSENTSPALTSTADSLRNLGRNFLDASALLVWGSVLCYFAFSGRLAAYLHPSFHPFVVVSGIILVVLGMGLFLFGGAEVCSCTGPGCPIATQRRWWWVLLGWLVVVVPLLVTAGASPSQFGATAVLNRGLVDSIEQIPGARASRAGETFFPTAPPGSPWAGDPSMDAMSYLARTPEGRIKAETIDLLFAAQDPPLRPDFEDQDIEIIGQYLPLQGENPPEDQFHLVRIFIMCCAADARPIGITVRGRPPEGLETMEWVKIQGQARFPKVNGRVVAVIDAENIEPTPAPPQPFLF